jgi:selenocysteine-specific elongation factor
MTIDLGFAFLGQNITFIDVPGHEKFIKNMLSGVATVDAIIFVIAADDGFMPQTEEHFEILKLLEVQRGLVALTKIDMVDPDWLDLLEEDIRERLKGSFLEKAPIFRVDSLSGKGVEELKNSLLELAQSLPPRPERGVFRMYVDRVFSIKGAGTVVAGTVLGGSIKSGDRVELQPKGLDVRIKRLQVHNQEVPQAHTGERTAINLQGVDIAQIERGDLLAQAGYFRSTYMLNVSYQHLSSADRPLENRARVRLHLGTAEYLARAVTLEKKPLLPGQSGFVQLRLESPTVCEIGDHFVIRDYSPGRTIGGGRILEVHPKKLKYLPEDEIEVLEVLEIGGSKELVETHLRRGGFQPFTPEVVARDMSRPASEIAELMEELVKDGTAIRLAGASGSWVVHQYIVAQAQEKLLATLDDFHKNTPWRLGLKRSTLAGQIFGTVDKAIYDAFLEKLVKEGQIELSGEIALRRSHKVQFNSQQEALAGKILQIYLETAFVTPEFEELVEKLEAPADKVRQVVNGLSDRGDLKEISIGVGKSLIFHTQRIEEARQAVLKLFEGKNEVAFFEVREVLNSTRKFTTPILNYFDQIGLTVRVGEIRMLKDKA